MSGVDLDGGERRLAARVRVERRDADEAMNAVLAPQVAEGVIAFDRERVAGFNSTQCNRIFVWNASGPGYGNDQRI